MQIHSSSPLSQASQAASAAHNNKTAPAGKANGKAAAAPESFAAALDSARATQASAAPAAPTTTAQP